MAAVYYYSRMTDTTRKSATSVNFGSAIGGDHGIGTVHRNADRQAIRPPEQQSSRK
jgi:hypothetical protein